MGLFDILLASLEFDKHEGLPGEVVGGEREVGAAFSRPAPVLC